MTQPLTPEHALKWIAPLLYDVSPHERLLAARALGDYSRDYCVCQVLLAALQDPSATVRCEIYKLLSRTEFSKYEGAMLLVVARRIRYALELEEEGSASWYCGKRALDRLSDYYEAHFMYLNRFYCPLWIAANSPF